MKLAKEILETQLQNMKTTKFYRFQLFIQKNDQKNNKKNKNKKKQSNKKKNQKRTEKFKKDSLPLRPNKFRSY